MSATQDELRSMFKEAERRGDRETAISIMDRIEKGGIVEQKTESPTFTQRVKEDLSKRGEEVKQTIESAAKGDIGTANAWVQLVGKGVAGSLFDFIGEEVADIGSGIAQVTPETVDTIKRGWDWISNTKAGEQVGDIVEGGEKKYSEFKKSYPEEAKTLESIVNIGMLFAPVKAKRNAAPSVLGKISEKAQSSATKTILKRKADFVNDLISPVKTKKVLISETARTTEEGMGPFKKSVVKLSPREELIAKEVNKIPQVTNKKTIQGNLNLINEKNIDIAKTLDKQVGKSKKIIPREEITSNVDMAVVDLIKDNPVIVGNAETIATRVATKAKEILLNHPNTPKGVLDSRKELDSWIKSQKGQKAFDPTMENALSASVRAIRDSMNDTVAKNVPNVMVKEELKRQSLLYDAIENIAPKAASESNTAILRAWQNAAKVLPFRGRINQELALLFGIGGLGAAATFAPWITGAAGVVLAGKGVSKIVMSPNTRIGISKLIKMVDRAILSSKNPSMVKQLRADRIALIEAAKSQESGEE